MGGARSLLLRAARVGTMPNRIKRFSRAPEFRGGDLTGAAVEKL